MSQSKERIRDAFGAPWNGSILLRNLFDTLFSVTECLTKILASVSSSLSPPAPLVSNNKLVYGKEEAMIQVWQVFLAVPPCAPAIHPGTMLRTEFYA